MTLRMPCPWCGQALRGKEGQQIGVDARRLGRAHAVWCTGIDFQRGILDDLRGQCAGILEGHDLVIVAMQNQCGDIDLLEVFGIVHFGKFLDTFVLTEDAAEHAFAPEFVNDRGRGLGGGTVEAIERHGEILIKLRAIRGHAGTNAIEHAQRQAIGVVR